MIFELVMLICFGAAWPLSIYKTAISNNLEAKSIPFLLTVFLGYMSGIIYKFLYNYDYVVYLYMLNATMVFADIVIYKIRISFLAEECC